MENTYGTEALALAREIHRLLSANEDALVMGSAEGRDTLIDGNFDLVALAGELLTILELAQRAAKPP